MAKRNEKKRRSRKKRRQMKSTRSAVQPGRTAGADLQPPAAGSGNMPPKVAKRPGETSPAQAAELQAAPGAEAAAQAGPGAGAKKPSAGGPAPQAGLAALSGVKPRKRSDAIRRSEGVFYRRRQWWRPFVGALIALCVMGAVCAGVAAARERAAQPAPVSGPASGLVSGTAPPAATFVPSPTASPTPAPSQAPLSEEEFWVEVQALLESSEGGTLVKVDAGPGTQAPQPVLAALFGRDVSLLIVWDGGEPVLINGINMYRYTMQEAYPLSRLHDTYRGFVMEHSAAPTDKPAFDLVFEG